MDSEVKQVGGTHYQSGYQHWDWVEDMGMGYLEGCATKYVARWRKKDGLKDLQKAETYINKLVRRHQRGRQNRADRPGYEAFHRFCEVNQVYGDEREICHTMLYWRTEADLHFAWSTINRLINGEKNKATF